MNMREGARGFSFCLPAPTAEKMATDVFFRDGSTIKEALVAFLMRHVNFIKRGAEERRSGAARGCSRGKAKCLFAFRSGEAAPLSVSLPLHFLPHRRIKAGQGASNHRVRCRAECVDVRAPLEGGETENTEGESRCWKI